MDAWADELAHRHLEVLLRASVDGILTKTLEGVVTSWNPACERIFGYSEKEALGQNVRMLYLPEKVAEEETITESLRAGGSVALREAPRVRKDGSVAWVSLSISPLRGASGSVDGALVIARDITERRRAEASFQTLLDAAPDAMVIVDASGKISLVNAQTESMFGYPRAALVGRTVEALIPADLRRRHETHRAGYMREPRSRAMGVGLTLRGERADGSQFPVEISLSPLVTEDGALVIAAIRDVTDRKRVEEEARRQLVARQLVRRILRDLTEAGGSSLQTRRALGRKLAAESKLSDVAGYLDAYLGMGIGELRLDKREGERYEFSGAGLLEMTPGASVHTCHISLGFLEGIVAVVEGASSLGTEVACQSAGAPRCQFIVKRRPLDK